MRGSQVVLGHWRKEETAENTRHFPYLSTAGCNTWCREPAHNSCRIFPLALESKFSAPLADSYCETLPVDGPPSFRGQSVKYVYKLTIGCQRVSSPIKLLRVPFRVLVLHGKATHCPPCMESQAAPCPADTLTFFPGLKDYQFPQDEAVAPSNPFLEEEEGLKKDSRLADLATELLMVATSRRSLRRSYSLLKPAVLLRSMEDISGATAKYLSQRK